MSVSQFNPRPLADHEDREPVPEATSDTKPVAVRAATVGALLWMVAGPMTLFLSTIALVSKAKSFWTVADVFYGLGLAAMFAGRWIEYRSGVAETTDGKPASVSVMFRYYLRLGLGGLALWVIAAMTCTVWLTR